MSTILEADDTGTLHLPAALLPHPGPRRRYRVETEGGQVVVDEAESAPTTVTPPTVKWDIEELRAWRKRVWGDRVFTEAEVREMREFERGDEP
jgi:hypothetical protein